MSDLDDIKARIAADMATVPAMEFREMLGYLASYSTKFSVEIQRGVVTREQVRAYADEALERARGGAK